MLIIANINSQVVVRTCQRYDRKASGNHTGACKAGATPVFILPFALLRRMVYITHSFTGDVGARSNQSQFSLILVLNIFPLGQMKYDIHNVYTHATHIYLFCFTIMQCPPRDSHISNRTIYTKWIRQKANTDTHRMIVTQCY